ncbi:exo-beta-N-acetylmuramidase NamZ family protein [Candidatus Colwellia aromaticivorans]|uniref:exo-beta-N-acetylmuramidase NamZ family protein n=1 Tax=Candidatus Colwellia aromaticivorans TaxID=2267621 RepID=UPI003CCC630A
MRHFFIKMSNKLTVLYLTLFMALCACTYTYTDDDVPVKLNNEDLILGAEQVTHYLTMLTGKRVGLVVNQTSQINNKHLVDVLIDNNVNVQAIFAPEHGFRGDHDAGEKFSSSIDEKTGIPLISIYGKNRKPSAELMANIDVIIFDIQDVGVRFYTYISSMHYMMEAAADAGVSFIVFDRPNPNGAFVDGPILESEFTSFVGMHKIPLLHGMTIAELALMFKGEGWLNSTNDLNLTVVSMQNYQRRMAYSLPIKPSPNLPNDIAINLYPSLGFFEATPVSIGRGTDFPFQVIGHDKISVGDFKFMPISTPGAASTPKLMNKSLIGQDLRHSNIKGVDLSFIIKWHQVFQEKNTKFFTRASFMDKLSGTDKLRKAIVAGQTQLEIKQSWKQGLFKFKSLRKPYLLYKDL